MSCLPVVLSTHDEQQATHSRCICVMTRPGFVYAYGCCGTVQQDCSVEVSQSSEV